MDSSVRSAATKFKQLRHFTAVTLLALGLGACVGAPLRPAQKPVTTAQPNTAASSVIEEETHEVASLKWREKCER